MLGYLSCDMFRLHALRLWFTAINNKEKFALSLIILDTFPAGFKKWFDVWTNLRILQESVQSLLNKTTENSLLCVCFE